MQQIVSYGANGLQIYADPTHQSFGMEDHGYTSNGSSPTSLRESLFSLLETESSNTIIMSVMVIEVMHEEEQLAIMQTTLERLAKESLEKDAQIKRQSAQIASLMKKLEK